MLISNFNKKIIILLYLAISSGNAYAVEYLDKISDKIKFPALKNPYFHCRCKNVISIDSL